MKLYIQGRSVVKSKYNFNLWQQSDNVPFEQSRNVLLTAPSFGDAGRTTTDDPSRSRPAGDVEEGEEEADHAARGGRGAGDEHAAGEAAVACVEEARRQGRDPRAAREAVEPEDREKHRAGGGEDLVGAGVRRVRADVGGGVPEQEARDRGEQGDGAAVDDRAASCGGRRRRRSSKCMSGGRGGAGLESWCSGTPASTTGWKGAERSCT